MDISLKGLRCFVAVAEERHFGRAADRLGIAQPAVSQQLQRLEAALDMTLVRRDGRGVLLTEAGAAFLPHARDTLESSRLAIRAGEAAMRGETGTVTIGLTPGVPPHRLADLMRQVAVARPGARLRVRETRIEDACAQLADGTMRFAVTSGFTPPSVSPPIEVAELAAEPLAVALHRDHPLARRETLTLPELAAERFTTIARDAIREQPFGLHGMCRRTGFRARKFAEVDDVTTQLALVATGLSAAALPLSMSRDAPADVTFVPLADQEPLRTMLLHDRRRGLPEVGDLLRIATPV
ncbi:LysR family transcriptional regulator [Symbioplanes lichenis]|uniref:LysR family transcriptional regulator n=1 Tax=Symbioplanes lichenis TaxID=1629072 RepID=UPI002739EA5B|nr:LysR substrate-binding domain-containing protein [Actinoplanes lichenis]